MKNPLFLLFSLLLTGAVVLFIGWQALFGITLLSFCTLLFSREGPPLTQTSTESVDATAAPAVKSEVSADGAGIEEDIEDAIDGAGWYYPLADKVLALSAANETSFGDIEPTSAQVPFNAVAAW
ncbi:hypothetical protein WKW79_02885 [Variovorax robiniae]|uniref:Uncharacterized protein n=1 Tax=Variovorax robiniae TaxID=1836199 RepID=A0ABU8X108_9BURK